MRLNWLWLAGAAALAGCSGSDTGKDAGLAPDGPGASAIWKQMAQDNVRAVLRDPASAVFADMIVRKNGDITATCGTVNSKNGFGGMTGPKRFVSGGVTKLEEQMPAAEFAKLWAALCEKGALIE